MHTYYILIDGYDAAPEIVGRITANRRRDAEAKLARRSHSSEQGLCWLVHSSKLLTMPNSTIASIASIGENQ